MCEFAREFVHEFKYEIRTNSRESVRIDINFLHEKLVMLRMACTVYSSSTLEVFCDAVVISYHLHLHMNMVGSMPLVLQLGR